MLCRFLLRNRNYVTFLQSTTVLIIMGSYSKAHHHAILECSSEEFHVDKGSSGNKTELIYVTV